MNKKNIICISIIFLLSVLFSFIFNNYSLFFKSNLDKNKFIIDNYNEYVSDDKKYVEINLNNNFVNKLIFEYESKKDISILISYDEMDKFDKFKLSSINDVLDEERSIQIVNFKNKIGKVTYSYSIEDELNIKKISVDNEYKFNYIIFIVIFLLFSLIYYIIINFKKIDNDSLHKHYIMLSFIVGLVMIISSPATTFNSWDDQIHFMNTYTLLGGSKIWNVGEYSMIDLNSIGRNSINSIEEQAVVNKYLNQNKKSEYVSNTGRMITYSKIAYIPSGIGFYLGKILHLPFTICFRLGKIFNLLAFVLIMGYAIKVSKVGKKILLIIGLLPECLFLATNYSYDSAVISGLTLSIVLLLNMFLSKEKLKFREMFVFLTTILYGCFPKAIYIPFILLFLFLPKNKFECRKQEVWLKTFIILIFVMMLATFITPSSMSISSGGDLRGGNTNTFGQLVNILNHPLDYIKLLKLTFFDKFFEEIVGIGTFGSFAYLGVINTNCYYLIFIIFMLSVISNDNEKQINKFNKILIAGVTIGIMILIWTALYLSFTPVGASYIDGVQPRYFIPLVFPFLLLFKNNYNVKFKYLNVAILIVMVGVLFISIVELIIIPFCL